MDHGIRTGKIEPHAPGLETDQEYRGIAPLKSLDQCFTIAALPG